MVNGMVASSSPVGGSGMLHSSWNCSIAEVVDTEDNRVEVVVESSNMLVGL